jgi:hypothetical protein
MNGSIDINLILQKIKDLESKSSSDRKLEKTDLTDSNKNIKKSKKLKQVKIKEYRMQEEHGEKKFIKP